MARLFIDQAGLRLGHRDHHHAGRRDLDRQLPISRYPTIAPPTVTINAVYPGASAKSVAG